MDENDVRIGTACMNKVIEVLKEFGCVFEIVVSFSSSRGPNFQVIARPQKNIVVSNQMPPKMGLN